MSTSLGAILGGGGGGNPFRGRGRNQPPKKPKKGGRKKAKRSHNDSHPFMDHPLLGGSNWSWMNEHNEQRQVFPTRLGDVRPPTGEQFERGLERGIDQGVKTGKNLYRGGKEAYHAGKTGYKNIKGGIGSIKARINKARGKDEGFAVTHSEAKGRMEFTEHFRDYGTARAEAEKYEKKGERSRVE